MSVPPNYRFGVNLLLVLLVATPLLFGCGPKTPTYRVTGTVHFDDGTPVRSGVVEFRHQQEGISARGQINTDGRFLLSTFSTHDGAPAGSYEVIVVQHVAPPIVGGTHSELPSEHYEDQHEMALVDPKHSDFSTSDLQAEVEPVRENEFHFTVSKAASRR